MQRIIDFNWTRLEIRVDDRKVKDPKTGAEVKIDKDDLKQFDRIYQAQQIAYSGNIFNMEVEKREKMLIRLNGISKRIGDPTETWDTLLEFKTEEALQAEMDRLMRLIIRKAKLKMPAAIRALKRQTQLNHLVLCCMVYADRRGKALEKEESNPFSVHTKVLYDSPALKITFYAQNSPYGNGSCSVQVEEKGRQVFDACGTFLSYPFNCTAKIYSRGEWEKIVRKFSEPEIQKRR